MRRQLLLFAILLFCTQSLQAQTTIRANALGWGAGVANIGFETALSNHFTILAEGYYSPFWDTDNFKVKGFLVTPELRYYFCEKFNKHYIGVHVNYADYSKFQPSSLKNIRDGFAYGAGITYGHTWIFNHHWSFDMFVGVGWWHMDNDIYCKNEPDLAICRSAVENKIALSRMGATFGYRF